MRGLLESQLLGCQNNCLNSIAIWCPVFVNNLGYTQHFKYAITSLLPAYTLTFSQTNLEPHEERDLGMYKGALRHAKSPVHYIRMFKHKWNLDARAY